MKEEQGTYHAHASSGGSAAGSSDCGAVSAGVAGAGDRGAGAGAAPGAIATAPGTSTSGVASNAAATIATPGARLRIVRIIAAIAAIALVAVLCVLQAMPQSMQIEPWQPTQGHINREAIMVLCALAVIAWAYSVYLRCSSATTMHCLLAIATLLVFWLALTIVKWHTSNDVATSILWYLFYVPMLAIPTLVLFSIMPQTRWSRSSRVRKAQAACFAVDGVLLLIVLTNNVHHAVFDFDMADPAWASAYTYAPVYVVVYAWIVAQYLGFLVIAFLNARKDLRRTLAVVALFVIVGVVYSLVYVFGSNVVLNLTVAHCLLLVIGLESALELGILPSFANYGELFQTVPYDVRVLDAEGHVCAQSDVAKPLPARLAERAVQAAQHAEGPVTLHLSQTPTARYSVYAVLGGYALATKDVSALVEQRNRLERRRAQLKRRNRALSRQSEIEGRLARQQEEEQVAQAVAETLAEKAARVDSLLDALPDDPVQARGQLALAKLLVSWCKQQGSLTLATEECDQVSPARLQLALGQIASDVRGVGVECGTLVDVGAPISARAANALYGCLYDLAEVGCALDDAIVMLYAQQDPATGDVRIRGVLQCADSCAARLRQECESLGRSRGTGEPPVVTFEDASARIEMLVSVVPSTAPATADPTVPAAPAAPAEVDPASSIAPTSRANSAASVPPALGTASS